MYAFASVYRQFADVRNFMQELERIMQKSKDKQNRGAKYEEVFTAYFNGSYAGAGFSGSALAKERLFTFSNNNNGAVKEVNYYLDNGAKVVFMDTAAKATDSTVIITVVLGYTGRCASISKVNSKKVPQALGKGRRH